MKFSKKTLYLTGIILLSSCSNIVDGIIDNMINVSIITDENCIVNSQNPIVIKKGEDASFDISFKQGFEFGNSSIPVQENNNIFTFKDIYYSQSIKFTSKNIGAIKLNVINDESLGTVSITPNEQFLNIGDQVTISVVPTFGNEFMCYSMEHSYRETNLYKPSGMAVSFANSYSFEIKENTTLYTNYFSKGLLQINYYANGGITIDSEEKLKVDYEIIYPRVNPVSILGSNYLFRNGFTLDSFNSKADGSGERISVGSRIPISLAENNVINLYAQWVEWTEYSLFSYETIEEGVVITGFSDIGLEVVTIPNVIEQQKVVGIKGETFLQCGFKKVIFNEEMKFVEKNAFHNCTQLSEVHLYTKMQEIYDDSFLFSKVKTIYINSHAYSTNALSHTRDLSFQLDQIESMIKERVIFVGQSTIRFNHDLTPFKNKYKHKQFYLFGMIAGCNFMLPLDILNNILNENDTVIISILETTMSPNYIGGGTFLHLKYCFDELAKLDYQNYKKIFFSSFIEWTKNISQEFFQTVFNSEKNLPYDSFGGYLWGPSTNDIDNKDLTYTPSFTNYQKQENFQYR